MESTKIINEITENTPNAGRLIEALRNTGYDNYAAVADLIDNSFDADATNIRVDIVPTKDDFVISIADDGIGMDEVTLDQAMRLGSLTDRNIESDLGKFGMGLVTASLSISRRLTVITKHENKYLTSIQDIDQVIKINKFEKELRLANEQEEREFDKLTNSANSGTVVVLEKCDLIQNKSTNNFSSKLIKEISQIFRYFIQSNKNIYIRGTKVASFDPLMLKEEGTETYSDETFEVDNFAEKENVRIRIAFLPNFDTGIAKIKEVNIPNQGFYLLRNNRDIAAGETLGIFTKHGVFNRVRIEIFFSGKLDQLMGVTFTKRNPKPKQQILDKIREITYPQLSNIRNIVNKSQVVKDSKDIDHGKAAKIIMEKSKLLIKPKAIVGLRGTATNHTGTVDAKNTSRLQNPENTRERIINNTNCKFELRMMGGGNFFDAYQVGKTTIIGYNVDHPFYQKFIVDNKNDQEIINAIDFLVFSLATAKLISSDDETKEGLFENFVSIFSSNLRTLIN